MVQHLALKLIMASLLLLCKSISGFHVHIPRNGIKSSKILASGSILDQKAIDKRERLHSLFSSATETSQEEKKVKFEPRRGHTVRNVGKIKIDPEENKIQNIFSEHQKNASKLEYPCDVRTLVEYNHGFAVISTCSKANPGYPCGSLVEFAPDELGCPIFVFSDLSTQSEDILNDPRCSVTIASKGFKGLADGRVNLMGEVSLVPKDEHEALKAIFLKKHPDAFWVENNDSIFFRMDKITNVHFVGGFAGVGEVTPEEYKKAKPDPISAFGGHIADHMNADHQDATIAMIASQIPGLGVEAATITSVDSLGMFIKVERTPRSRNQPQQFKLRLPFPRPAENRGDIKKIIAEMAKAEPLQLVD